MISKQVQAHKERQEDVLLIDTTSCECCGGRDIRRADNSDKDNYEKDHILHHSGICRGCKFTLVLNECDWNDKRIEDHKQDLILFKEYLKYLVLDEMVFWGKPRNQLKEDIKEIKELIKNYGK